MKWEPGKPVVTAEDVEAWQAWKKESKLAGQRHRRAMYPRIDYYPSKEAHAVILAHVGYWVTYTEALCLTISVA